MLSIISDYKNLSYSYFIIKSFYDELTLKIKWDLPKVTIENFYILYEYELNFSK